MFLITFIGNTEYRICCIQANTSLEATGCDVSTPSLHHHLLHQIIGALMQVSKTIDFFP
jgi:hypothetical protein